MDAVVWILTAVGLLMIEALTLGLTTIWFAGGAIVAFVVSLLGGGLPLQLGIFMGVSMILLIFTRPLAQKYFNGRIVHTNVENLPGKSAVVTERIDNDAAKGQVQIDGVVWSARTADGSVLEQGTKVIIKEVQGVKLIVALARKGE